MFCCTSETHGEEETAIEMICVCKLPLQLLQSREEAAPTCLQLTMGSRASRAFSFAVLLLLLSELCKFRLIFDSVAPYD